MAFYAGSRLLEPFATLLGLPLDQVNFMVGEVFALILAFVYRSYLRPKDVGVNTRHGVACFFGMILGFFCFGRGMLHMLAQAGICYVIMLLGPPKVMHILVFVVAMVYLSVMHIYRMSYDYGGYMLDVTGPLMISTQKVTSLAFSLHDGLYKKKESLNPDQNRQAVRTMPGLLTYLSYVFYFQGLLAGPLCFFADYIAFVEGKNFHVIPNSLPDTEGELPKEPLPVKEPSPTLVVLQKLSVSLFMLSITLFVAPMYPPEKLNSDTQFVATHNFFYRLYIVCVSITLARAKYYFAWKFGEAVNNASGLGFNGYDKDGTPKWNLVTNVNIRKLETATSLKVLIDNWNVQTAIWLRRICYDRAPVQKTLLTYVLSALWHGFYPGYYFTFIAAAFFTEAARAARRNIRPHFQKNDSLRILYDVCTWFCAQVVNSYLIVPFCVLSFWPTFYYYTYSMYWSLHIVVIIMLLVLPGKPREPRKSKVDGTKVAEGKTPDLSEKVPHSETNDVKVKQN